MVRKLAFILNSSKLEIYWFKGVILSFLYNSGILNLKLQSQWHLLEYIAKNLGLTILASRWVENKYLKLEMKMSTEVKPILIFVLYYNLRSIYIHKILAFAMLRKFKYYVEFHFSSGKFQRIIPYLRIYLTFYNIN